MRITCMVCALPLEQNQTGRPQTTCGPRCARAWGAARKRAARARTECIRHLGDALPHAQRLSYDLGVQVRRVMDKLQRCAPNELARVPMSERDLTDLDA